MQNGGIAKDDSKRGTGTCAVVFDGLTLLIDFTVVDVGSSPTTSTAARTLAMLVVLIPQLN